MAIDRVGLLKAIKDTSLLCTFLPQCVNVSSHKGRLNKSQLSMMQKFSFFFWWHWDLNSASGLLGRFSTPVIL
jgi:hypothetical protein